MRTRLSNVNTARGLGILIGCAVLALAAMPTWAQQTPAVTETAAPLQSADSAPVAAGQTSAGGVTEADQHFRNGVSLYNRGLFLEALSEFNRALALDPQMENAKIYRDKSNAKLAISAAGKNPNESPSFEAVDPESIPAGENPQLSADEMKIRRVAELTKQGEKYLENQRYSRAVSIFEEILLIAPDNENAKTRLHEAIVGASKEAVSRAEDKVTEDRSTIRKFIEQSKQLPEGADPTGIKQYRISVPVAEEQSAPPHQRTPIEKTLDSFVSIEFENIHLSEILDFISSSYSVNIVSDDRVIMRPQKAAAAPAATTPTTPGVPGMPGGAAPFPGAPGAATQQRPGATPQAPGARPTTPGGPGQQPGANANLGGEYVTDGMVSYITLKNVPLRDALKALLRPLNLDYSVQPGFIWISTPEKIRLESFEELETRYYELRNAGAETLFKIVLRNPGGSGGTGYGSGGYGGGGMSGGYGNRSGYGGGSSFGSSSGYGSSFGGSGSYGGGSSYGSSSGFGGSYGSSGMGGYGSSGMGGYGSSGYGSSGYGSSGMGGGMGGSNYGGGGIQIQNISQLFGTISDTMVGETPAIIGTAGLSSGGTGTVGTARYGGTYGGGMQGATGPAQLGGTAGRADNLSGDEPEIVRLLRLLVDDVYEPNGTEPISRMIYVPHNNQLIVVNTPTNLNKLEKQLAELDVTPKQVSIEAKFLTIKAEDLDKIGFKWDVTQSDLNGRNRAIPDLKDNTYNYDINGDGVNESIPFYTKPNGSNVITNTVGQAVMAASASPGPAGAFSLTGILTDNEDGDKVSVVLDYLNTLEETELLSAPRVTTMNRKPAVIADLTTEYFVSSVQTEIVTTEGTLGGSGRLGYTQRIQPQPFNFGITLSVTPQISGGDQVRLWLNPQVTTRGLEKKFTQKSIVEGTELTDEITLPNTSTQAVWTNVIVHDGDTLVLGGLVSDQTIKGEHKLPYLADIPVLGFFFKGKSKQVTQSSLLIFVTPTIIDTTGARFFEAQTGPSAKPKAAATGGEAEKATSEAPAAATQEAIPVTVPEETSNSAVSSEAAPPLESAAKSTPKNKKI